MKTMNIKFLNLESLLLRLIIILVLVYCFPYQINAQCTNEWSGSSPTTSFELNGTIINNYSITLVDVGCFSSINFTFSSISLNNGSFTHNFTSYPNSGTITGSLSTDGNSITGTYDISLAYLHPIYGYPVSCGTTSGNWNASADTPLPTADAGSDFTVCAGQSVTLTATGGESYSWSGGITNGVAFTPAETGTYTVTVTAANGCEDTDDALVTVNSLPTADAGSDVTVCAGQSVTLTATGGESYSWSGGITNGVAFTPTETGTYTVTVTTANGCTDTSNVTVTVDACTFINQSENNIYRINLYPNPVHDELNISIEKINSSSSITITSIDGKIIFSKDYVNFLGSLNEMIRLNSNCKGVYFILVKNEQMIKTEKIIVK